MKLEGSSVKKLPVAAAVMAVVAALSGPAMAYQAGDVIVRAGAATVDPDVDSGKLKANGAVVNPADPTTVDVDSDTQLGLSMTYMLDDKFGIELLAATPFQHTIKTKGGLASLGKLADVKHLPPTLTLQYYPMDSSSAFQPYVGLGLNYTTFFDEEFKGSNKTAFRGLELKDSWGLAAQLGADYRIDDNWSVNAAVWYVDIDTEAKFKSADGTTKYKVDVELDPMVYMVGVAYKF
ncbi:outer membrane beta-barrel protein [Kistimonas scapharcae]|uniref:Outer membrane beta-barrel protein n=1 Tax=Kistimonas scapharcae TaxID=1036133 RepID=A0ABP8V8U3_9GAMM